MNKSINCEKKIRHPYFDNVKFFLILIVVIGHFLAMYIKDSKALKAIWIYINSFHMPLFLFIGGLFFKFQNNKLRIISYFSIFVLFKIAIIVISNIFDKKLNFTFLGTSGADWYIFCLMIYIFITSFLSNVNLNIIFLVSLLFALGVGFDKSINSQFYLSRIINFYPYFLLGVIITRDRIYHFCKNKILLCISIFILVLYLIICIFNVEVVYELRPYFSRAVPYSQTNYAEWGIMLRLLSFFISLTVGGAFMFIVPKCHIPIISLFGTRTLQVYFWHYIIRNMFIHIDYFKTYSLSNAVIVLVFSILLTFILSTKIFIYPTSFFSKEYLLNKRLDQFVV